MSPTSRRYIRTVVCGALMLTHPTLHADTAETVGGYWLDPSGAVIRIARCEDKLCVEIAALPPGDHPNLDVRNPSPRLRQRPLCGLRIGEDFAERDSQHADGGWIYDPKTGRTYRGSMTAEGGLLKLRGFIGLKLFGRTETWTRARQVPTPCQRR